jgi:hypothetical protein
MLLTIITAALYHTVNLAPLRIAIKLTLSLASFAQQAVVTQLPFKHNATVIDMFRYFLFKRGFIRVICWSYTTLRSYKIKIFHITVLNSTAGTDFIHNVSVITVSVRCMAVSKILIRK